MEIRQLSSDIDLQKCVQVIRESFGTISGQFDLTRENCPSHPAFICVQDLENILARGAVVLGAFDDDRLVGLVIMRGGGDGRFSMEKLSVLPEYRHLGIGAGLVDAGMEYAKQFGGTQVDIGIIDQNTVLKNWYASLGFIETGKQTFPHLPFTVCFMQAQCRR